MISVVTFTNEIQILSRKDEKKPKFYWQWYDKLEDASNSMFWKRKKATEDELNKFFYSQDWMVDSGYIRSVVYYFKKGDTHDTYDSINHIKAYVEMYFTSDTNMTFEYLQERQEAVLIQNNGWLSEGQFKLHKKPTLESKKYSKIVMYNSQVISN